MYLRNRVDNITDRALLAEIDDLRKPIAFNETILRTVLPSLLDNPGDRRTRESDTQHRKSSGIRITLLKEWRKRVDNITDPALLAAIDDLRYDISFEETVLQTILRSLLDKPGTDGREG
ncbi:hypothetical protein AYL99_11614 [Fonsecaea erecta]|uniref:Uncharacterized protein n=1 Tax=Fonsecaea erecta TaxID=1367422 RepID=A0A178Z2T8_9EURO|nr:hypothetical protein AYL99_11614 [Fonsecaea erecta]OAP54080.1 hypothetical protein AYL99_11614 [Fonsecaea erecta]